MIVKDEGHIIRRCLEAARPLVDFALIVDTGSSDDTILVASQTMRDLGLDGLVVAQPWRDFAHNRSLALATLRERADIDYALMIDADDRLVLEDGFDAAKAALTLDLYNLQTRLGGCTYLRPQMISNRKPFRFKGVLHEFLACDEPFDQGELPGLHVLSLQDSARNQRPDKFRRDARTLEQALASETDEFLRARYTFYLAQSYRDGGQAAQSIETYLARAEMGFWEEEVFCSLLYAARQIQTEGQDHEAAIAAYLRAADVRPGRAEALHGASRLCRILGDHARGFEIAARGVGLTPPSDGLFVEPWIYDFGLLDEYAVHAFWTSRHRESLDACLKALARDDLPPADRARIAENARFALDGLAGDA